MPVCYSPEREFDTNNYNNNNNKYWSLLKDRTNVVVMGDLIQDTDVVNSLHQPDNVMTFGFLNEKVCHC